MGAGAGVEPASLAYEISHQPLIYPAYLVRMEGLEPSRLLTDEF